MCCCPGWAGSWGTLRATEPNVRLNYNTCSCSVNIDWASNVGIRFRHPCFLLISYCVGHFYFFHLLHTKRRLDKTSSLIDGLLFNEVYTTIVQTLLNNIERCFFFFRFIFSGHDLSSYSFISRRSMEWFRRGSDLNKYRWGHPMTGSRHWRKTRVLLMRWWRDEKAQKARELTYHTAWPRSILLLDASIQPSIQHIEPAAPRLDLQRAFPPAALCSFHHISTPTIRAGSAIVFFLPHPLIRDSFISFRYSLNGDRGYWSSSHYLTLVFRPNSIHH